MDSCIEDALNHEQIYMKKQKYKTKNFSPPKADKYFIYHIK